MMHMVITNAYHGDPYPIDTLFMYMANMAWNSAMNTGGTIEMLTAKDAAGAYRIPRIIYADAYFSETVAYADLILPDTTYLERWDCISLLDRPISSADGPADAIRQPVLEPDRDVRPFQDVLLDLGARLGLPGMVDDDGKPLFPNGYPDYLVHHQRKPGIGSLAGWRGDGGEPNPDQLQRYVENGCFWQGELAPGQRYFKHANQDYLDYAVGMGFIDRASPVTFQLYSEVLQKFRLAAQGVAGPQPPRQHRERIETYFDPLPFWYPSLDHGDEHLFPMHAVTQRPMAMYHSWGSQNAWLRQLHTSNRLYLGTGARGRAGPARWRLDLDHQPARPRQGAGPGDGGRQPGHVLDLERDRQAGRRLAPVAAGARGDQGVPAQPPDRRAAAGPGRRLPLRQRRSGDRPGGLVRPAGPAREG